MKNNGQNSLIVFKHGKKMNFLKKMIGYLREVNNRYEIRKENQNFERRLEEYGNIRSYRKF